VVVIVPVTKTVINPAGCRVDQSSRIERLDTRRQVFFWIIVSDLCPTFIIDDLLHH
jgi:hypothetical protein